MGQMEDGFLSQGSLDLKSGCKDRALKSYKVYVLASHWPRNLSSKTGALASVKSEMCFENEMEEMRIERKNRYQRGTFPIVVII